MRLYMCACERCGKEVPATLAGYAKMVLRNSARIDGKARALCPECAESLRARYQRPGAGQHGRRRAAVRGLLGRAAKPYGSSAASRGSQPEVRERPTARKLDAETEETAVQNLRKGIETTYEASRERALALTKLDECELWLGRCEPRATASPTLKGAAQDAAMPCLKAEEAHGFAMPDVNVEVKAEVTAEELAKSLREAMKPAMRMAVE